MAPPTMTTETLSATSASVSGSAPGPLLATPSTRNLGEEGEIDGPAEVLHKKFDDVEEEHDIFEDARIKVKKFMSESFIGRTYENVLIVVAVFSGLQYIVTTYSQYLSQDEIGAFQSLEIVLAVVFGWDWFFCLALADRKIDHFTSFYSMIDLLTIIPIWVTRVFHCMDYNNIITSRDTVIYILCALTTTRLLRSLRLRRKLILIDDEVTRLLTDIAINIVVALLFFAALMQFLEQQDAPQLVDKDRYPEFHTWCYYVVVTLSSVGYGDIAPISTLGRVFAMFMIAFAYISASQMSTALISKLSEQSIYARMHYVEKYKATHVFVCGDISTMSIMPFVNELFHEDHEDENINAVFMSPDSPSAIIRNILRDTVLSLRVTFLEGSALSERDLKRSKVIEAKAIFIMTNKFSDDPDKMDSQTILQQFFLKKVVMRQSGREKPLFGIQLIRPENLRHFVDSTSIEDSDYKPDIILCLNEIKMGIIAKAVMFPGSNTLLMNLLTSFADDDDDDDEAEDDVEGDKGLETEDLDKDDQDNWVGEYQRGCGWEVYTTRLNPMFSGATFAALADVLYQRIGVVLFGLRVEDLKRDRAHARMLLNPADYVIPNPADCFVEAFVIAENKNNSDLTFEEDEDDKDGSKEDRSQSDERSSGGAMAIAAAAAARGLGFSSTHGSRGYPSPPPSPSSSQRRSQVRSSAGYVDDGMDEPTAVPLEYEWKSLLRKYQTGGSMMISSSEELESRVEKEFMRNNFFTTLPDHPRLASRTIHTSLDREAPYVNNHTIVVGKRFSNLLDLILPLRSQSLGYIRPIVILSPVPLPADTWNHICIFQGVFVMHGSGLEEQDLVRAGIFKAAQCIFLSDTEASEDDTKLTSTSGAKAQQAALMDADGIFVFQSVMAVNPQINMCVEIVNAANVGFLDPKEGLVSGDVDYKFTPQFASGALLTSSLLDTLICQAFYNRSIVAIIQLFASGVTAKDRDVIKAEIEAGRPLTQSETAAVRRGVAAVVGSGLYQIKVPDQGEVRTYGEMFSSFTKKGILPLGLYRGVFKNMNVGPKQNKMPYVFTNPPKETELFSCDKVFVLSQKPLMGKRTVSKRSDWSLIRHTHIEPMDVVKSEAAAFEARSRAALDRVESRLGDVVQALAEVAGKEQFKFQRERQQEEDAAYKLLRAKHA